MDSFTADLEAQSRYEQSVQKTIWTGALVNGAALVAMCNIIANVSDPDGALETLAPAMNLFAVGLLAGGMAIQTALRLPAIWASVLISRASAFHAIERQKLIQPAVSEWPMDPQLAKLIHGDNADAQLKKLYAERVAAALKAVEESGTDFTTAQDHQTEAQKTFTNATLTATRWNALAIGLAVLGFGLSVDGIYVGRELQPHHSAPARSTTNPSHQPTVPAGAIANKH